MNVSQNFQSLGGRCGQGIYESDGHGTWVTRFPLLNHRLQVVCKVLEILARVERCPRCLFGMNVDSLCVILGTYYVPTISNLLDHTGTLSITLVAIDVCLHGRNVEPAILFNIHPDPAEPCVLQVDRLSKLEII